mgnify:FL=1|jgi:hypothetical protein|tara:strand:- start:53 stop:358 length:306 start_codon:yes stop_codon:yes gene_type:complete
MAYKMVVESKGNRLLENINIIDDVKDGGLKALEVLTRYESNGWITSNTREDVSDTHKIDTIIFESKEKRLEFKTEMDAIHGGDPSKISSVESVVILEEGEV